MFSSIPSHALNTAQSRTHITMTLGVVAVQSLARLVLAVVQVALAVLRPALRAVWAGLVGESIH